MTMGPKWWKANSAARKIGMALNRSIGEAIRARGVSKPDKYVPAIPLWRFLIDQVGIQALLPEEVIAAANALSVLAGPAAGQAAREQFVRDHLPTGGKIANSAIDQRRRGLPLDDDIFLYGPGVASSPSGPLGSSQRNRAIAAGRYSGPGAVALIEQWVAEVAARVGPAGFHTARMRLEALVGNWKGTSEWGVWREADGFAAGSQLGFFDEFRVRMWREFEEAQDKCDVQRADDQRFKESLVTAAVDVEKLKASRWWIASAAVVLAAAVGGRRGGCPQSFGELHEKRRDDGSRCRRQYPLLELCFPAAGRRLLARCRRCYRDHAAIEELQTGADPGPGNLARVRRGFGVYRAQAVRVSTQRGSVMKPTTIALLLIAAFAAFKAVEAATPKQVGAIPNFNPRLRSQG